MVIELCFHPNFCLKFTILQLHVTFPEVNIQCYRAISRNNKLHASCFILHVSLTRTTNIEDLKINFKTTFAPFHMHDSRQHFVKTEGSGNFVVARINKRLVSKNYTDSDSVKMEKLVTHSEPFRQNDFDLETAIQVWTKIHDN